MGNGGFYTKCLLKDIKGEKYDKRKLFWLYQLEKLAFVGVVLALIILSAK